MTNSATPLGDRSPSPPPGLYLSGPWIDWAAMGGLLLGAWLILMLYAGSNPEDNGEQAYGVLKRWSGILALGLSFPHFAASVGTFYSSRERLRQNPVKTFFLPMLVLFGVLLAIRYPILVLPCLCKVALLWLGMHYSSQTLGLSLMYARRSGLEIGPWTRWIFASLAFSLFLYSSAALECQPGSIMVLDVAIPALHLPGSFQLLAGLWLAGSFVAGLGWVIYRHCGPRQPVPAIIYVPILAQAAWLVFGVPKADYEFLISIFALGHGMQYLLWSWVLRDEAVPKDSAVKESWPNSRLRYGLMLGLGGWLLFRGLPWGFGVVGFPQHLMEPALVSGILIHHCLTDGELWETS